MTDQTNEILNAEQIGENLAAVQADLVRACNDASRADDAVHLVAVSKTKPVESIQAALTAGQRIFGENRVQEAQSKFPDLKTAHPDLELHLIGPLQSNKAKDAVALFDVIQTLDRPKLITALARASEQLERTVACYLQVNTGAEPQKAGVLPEELEDLLKQSVEAGLNVTGLMCIPPVDEPAAPHFALLKQRAHELGLPNVSMGMSGDYAIAAGLGATHVRVGSALFGGRAKPA